MQKSRKKRRKKFITFLICFFILLFLYRYTDFFVKRNSNNEFNSDELEIHVIDVGQAESILLIQGDNTMLIDTGEIFSGKEIVDYISSIGIDRIDILLLTHFHRDHVGGTHKIISSFEIGKIICMDKDAISNFGELAWYTDMRIAMMTQKFINDESIELDTPYNEYENLKEMDFGEAKLTFLSQNKDADIVNNKSIVMKLEYGDFSALFMSDAQKEVERQLVEKNINLSADLLKVSHHGSHTSSINLFLDEVSPKYAIISCEKNNKYLHPHKSVLRKLKNRKIQIYRTDLEGSIVVKTDGTEEGIKIITECDKD